MAIPERLLAPLLRYLTLSNISLPMQSQLLRRAENLVTLQLCDIPASPEFHPAHLVAQLSGMSRLESLIIQFYTPIPNRIFESPARPTPITFPSLKGLALRGGSACIEGTLARINAPLLSSLNVVFFTNSHSTSVACSSSSARTANSGSTPQSCTSTKNLSL